MLGSRARNNPDRPETHVSRASRLIAVIVVLASLGGGFALYQRNPAAPPPPAAKTGLYKGIEQRQLALGSSKAPIVLYEFVDLQCDLCAQYTTRILPKLINRYVRNGKVRVEMRPVALLGPSSQLGARAVLAAGERDLAFSLAEQMYRHQGKANSGYLTDKWMRVQASAAGLDDDWLIQRAQNQQTLENLDAASSQALQAGVDHVPSFVLVNEDHPGSGPKPLRITALKVRQFTRQIDRALKKSSH